MTALPKAKAIVPYIAYSTPSGKPNGVLHVFGDFSSPKMALMCPGFPDDQTVFLPFAKALSEQGVLVGVMCLPGYEDRPEDGFPWESHPREGFSYDDTAKAVREAAKTLKGVSTYPDAPEFTGIFHDWGVIAGTMWAERAEQEAKDNAQVLMPNKMVFLDVLCMPSSKMPDYIRASEVPGETLYQGLCCLYMVVFAITSAIQLYLPRRLAAAYMMTSLCFLRLVKLIPVEMSDYRSTTAIYGDRKPSKLRWMSMNYMYRNIFTSGGNLPSKLHRDWKTTPILYLYGKKKFAVYHAFNSLAMLEREEAEKRSLSRAVGLEDAGHFLYVQKEEECLKHVLDFIRAENTFVKK